MPWLTALIMALVGAGWTAAHGQTLDIASDPEAVVTASEEERASARAALAELGAEIRISQARRQQIKAEIDALEARRQVIADALANAAGRAQNLERQITASERRLQRLETRQDAVRAALDEQHGALIEVLAALQRLGRRPPPALVVSPDDVTAAVRGAILLNGAMPELQARARRLEEDLDELVQIRTAISTENRQLAAAALELAEEQARLTLLVERRQRERDTRETALAAEMRRAQSLAAEAESLEEAIEMLEARMADARRQAEAAARAAEDAIEEAGVETLRRLGPTVAFADLRGKLPLPAAGRLVRDWRTQDDGLAGPSEGQTFAVRASAQVTAPMDAWVLFAGSFRSYGEVLILDAGDSYHMLMTGLSRISATPGQFVLAGEPIGVINERRIASASDLDLGIKEPTLYIELRHNGKPTDPSPWWSTVPVEKVGG